MNNHQNNGNNEKLIIETVTDNKNRTASEIRHILTKHGGSLGGSVIWQFNHKGRVATYRGLFD